MKDLKGMDAVKRVSQVVRNLGVRLDIPQHINDIGGNEEDIVVLSQKAFNDPCTDGNPRETSLSDFEELFRNAF